MGFKSAFKGLMYIYCALVGAIKDSVSFIQYGAPNTHKTGMN